jgi:hypothetical protein
MVAKRASRSKAAQAGARHLKLADGLVAAPMIRVYAVPYYTRNGSDTEYLISNANPTAVDVEVVVFGRDCRIRKRVKLVIQASCTANVRLRPIVPDHASFCGVICRQGEVIIHILYLRAGNSSIVGGELAGRDNLYDWKKEASRTYGFGYRTQPAGSDPATGALFVSNPHGTTLTGQLVYYGQSCKPVGKHRVTVKPGCTLEYPFPRNDYGFGLITVSRQPVLNVLHFTASTRGLAAAELLGEANRVTVPSEPPQRRSKVLFDFTHGCRAGLVGDWIEFEAALVAAGYPVAHHTAPTVTLAALQKHHVFVMAMVRVSYTAAEKQAIVDFVNAGGSVLVVQDFGNAPWSVPTRDILNLFGANDDNNVVDDPTNAFTPGQGSHAIFDAQRNFLAHPIVTGLQSFHVNAAASLSGDPAWSTVVETDDDSMPSRRPVVIARAFGGGRVVAFGDSNTWADHAIADLENRRFGVRTIEWLLFRI